jgi:hypothetical protein
MAIDEVVDGTVIDWFKIVDRCLLCSCFCCVLVVVGVTLLVSFTNIVPRI